MLVVACDAGAEQQFERYALPVLEERCLTSACHGVAKHDAWPSTPGFFVRLGDDGAVADVAQARLASRARVTTRVSPELSSLVRRPMPEWADGGPHFGGALFTGPDDPAARDLMRWIESEPDGAGEDVDLTDLQQLFEETVLPVIVERCSRDGCHGPTNVAFSALSARPARDGQFAPREVAAAYEGARKHLDLWSDDPRRSRLIQKALGEADGGIVHRGGVGTLFPEAPEDDPFAAPGIDAMLAWARAERRAVGVRDDTAPTGLVYVKQPPGPRAPYRIEQGAVGADLYYVSWPVAGEAPKNLTQSLRGGQPAEVREPAVSHDGERVVFAMRLQNEAVFSLWEIALVSGEGRKLRPAGAAGSFVAPRYAPGGGIVAVWDGHGEIGSEGEGVPPELVALGADGGAFTRLTYTPVAEVAPSFIPAGKAAGDLVFGTRRQGTDGSGEGVLFRFPLCHDPKHHGEPEYHVHFGASIAPRAPLYARDLPDGRQVLLVLSSSGATDDRGQLELLDRSLGPALSSAPPRVADEWTLPASPVEGDGLSIGGYRDPLLPLDPGARYRDPVPLPDASLLVSIDSAERPEQDQIVHARIVRDGRALRLELGEILLSEPGYSLRGAAPVFIRPNEEQPHPMVVDTTQAEGTLVLRDVRVLEALYGRSSPRGARTLRDDIRAVRVLQWRRTSAGSFRAGEGGGSSAGLTSASPVQLLDEVPLEADGSAAITVRARTPLRLQWLDARGMVVGNQLDRFYYAEGNELVTGGTNPTSYAHVCAGCHGALSGAAYDAQTEPPDALSSASLTLATHTQRNPRAPRSARSLPEEAADVDFVHDVAPKLPGACASAGCHSGPEAAAGLDLQDPLAAGAGAFSGAYERLIAHVDRAGLRARSSALVERLSGEEFDAPPALASRCPPLGASSELVRDVARWIETGAFYDLSRLERADAP